MNFRASTLVPLALFAAMGGALYLGLHHNPKILPSVLLNQPVPQFDLPPLEAGKPGVQSTAFKGKGVTLVNVFASWCNDCRYEMPYLMRLAQEKRVTVVGIDWKDTQADAAKYLDTFGNPYSAIGADESGRTGIDLGISGVPETFVVDKDGRVRLRVPGGLTPEIWDSEIEPLLKDGKSS